MSDEVKRECLELYVNGMGFRGIERVKKAHHTTVISWVKQVGERLPDAYIPETRVAVSELDEADAGGGESTGRPFFVNQQVYPARGRRRRLKSLVGTLKIRQSQAERMGMKAYSRLSSELEKASLRLIANESFHNAESKKISTKSAGRSSA